MKLSVLFISLICFLPALANSQYGAFGPVPDCNCGSGNSAPKHDRKSQQAAQKIEVTAPPGIPVLTQAELKVLQRRMAEKIVAQAGREADARALDQSDALGFAVPVLEVTLDGAGHVQDIIVVRWPSNDAARSTVDIAISAIRNAAPYRGIAKGIHGLKIMQTFVFKNDRKFYLRALEN